MFHFADTALNDVWSEVKSGFVRLLVEKGVNERWLNDTVHMHLKNKILSKKRLKMISGFVCLSVLMNAALNVFILYLRILKGTMCNFRKILFINDTSVAMS